MANLHPMDKQISAIAALAMEEEFRGQPVWDAKVEVFEMHGLPAAISPETVIWVATMRELRDAETA